MAWSLLWCTAGPLGGSIEGWTNQVRRVRVPPSKHYVRNHRLSRSEAGRARSSRRSSTSRIRGYDSAGIALVRDGEVEVRRSAGKLSCLVESVNAHPLQGDYGIGHTRWATHGKPTADNAHPHRDCSGRIVVVHNGIIENYLELKHRLQAAGHRFTTDTDTEVVAHLVEQEWNGDGLEGAVRRALQSIRGVFGLVFVCADDPGKIVAVREGPPIVVGIGDGEFLVASDIPPILRYPVTSWPLKTGRWPSFAGERSNSSTVRGRR